MRRLANGRITTHYDPALVRQLVNFPNDFEQWDAYDALDLKMLVLRGVTSDLLLPDVAQAMTLRGPHIGAEFKAIVENYIEKRFGSAG